ncbi:MAG: Ig-like domain-containing protein, partial [Thermoplasmata archaeon]
ILNVTDYPVTSLTALPSYSSLALYVNSTTELIFTVGGENPPFYTYYRILDLDLGIVVKGWYNYTADGANFSMSWGEGTFKIEYYSNDTLGKNEKTRTRIVIVDDSAPQTSLDIGEPWHRAWPFDIVNVTSATRLSLSAMDNPSGLSIAGAGMSNASGIDAIRYRIQNDTGQFVRDWTLIAEGVPFYLDEPSWADGYYTVWFYSTDNLNQAELANNITVFLDNTGPQSTIDIGSPNWTTGTAGRINVTSTTPFAIQSTEFQGSMPDMFSVEFKLTFEDLGVDSGWLAGSAFNVAGTFFRGDGNYTIEFRSKDNLGNMQGTATLYIYVDDSPPSLGQTTGPPLYRKFEIDIYNISDASMIAISSSDGAGSGISSIEHRIFNAFYDSGWQPYSEPFNLTGLSEGTYTIQYRASDNLGNAITSSLSVYLDIEAPTTSLNVGKPSYGGDAAHILNITSKTPLSLVVLYENGSGIASLEYRITGGAYDSGWKNYAGEFFLNSSFADGEYTIYFRGQDNMGNPENTNTVVVRLDNLLPASVISPQGKYYLDTQNDVLYVSVSNLFVKNGDDGSGIAGIWHRVRDDLGNYRSGWLSTSSFSLSYPDGMYVIEFYAVDNLGNTGITDFLTICLDTSSPTSQHDIGVPKYRLRPADDWRVSKDTEITLEAQETEGSGVAHIYYSVLDREGTLVLSSAEYLGPFNISGLGEDGLFTIRYWAVDRVGNLEQSNEIKLVLDSTPPSIVSAAPRGTGNSIHAFIQVIFSEVVSDVSVENTFSVTDGINVYDRNHGFFNWNGNTMAFYPYENLSYATQYTVTITAFSEDHVKNKLDGDGDGIHGGEDDDYTWQFKTADKPDSEPPSIVAVHPALSVQDVAVKTDIRITFSEGMNEYSVEAAFSFTDGIQTYGQNQGTITWAGNTTIFTPAFLLDYDTEYTVTISGLAADISGNFLESDFEWSFRTEKDSTPPEITGHFPTGENASIHTDIAVIFNEPMDRSTLNDAFIIIPEVHGSFSWKANRLTFIPNTPLLFGTTYFVIIGAEAQDIVGNALDFPYEFSFTTEPDKVPPFVVGHSPGEEEVGLDITVKVTFSEVMDKVSVMGVFEITPRVEGSLSWEGSTLIFEPTNLAPGTTYTVTIGTNAMDSAGNALAEEYTFTFTTKVDPFPPTVTQVQPEGSNVPVDTQIRITFSEPMDNASLYGAFRITPYAPGTLNWDGNTLVFTPSGKLAGDTTYNITLSASARDRAGNMMEDDYGWEFTTEDHEGAKEDQFPWEVVILVFLAVVLLVFILFLRRELRAHWLKRR